MKRTFIRGAIFLLVVAAALIAVALSLRQREPQIHITAYYPFKREGFFIADHLEELARQQPDRVRFTYYCYGDDDGYEEWRKTGLECGGVFINGRNKFQVTLEGKSEDALFIKRMGVFWTKDQFQAALDQVMEEVY